MLHVHSCSGAGTVQGAAQIKSVKEILTKLKQFFVPSLPLIFAAALSASLASPRISKHDARRDRE